MVFKKFKTLLITSTLPILIGTTLLLFFLYSDVIKAVGVGLVCALAVGLILFLEALFFSRFSPAAWGITIVQFIILPITGLLFTGFAFWPAALAPQGAYIQLEPPPETPINFVQGSTQNIFGSKIYVQAASGQTYLYDCVTYQGCTWVQETTSSSQPDSHTSFDSDYCRPDLKTIPFVPPISPMGVIDRIFIRSCGPDFEIHARYILLKDGKIYGWTRYWNPLEAVLGIPVFGLLGMISGLSTAIATLSRRKIAHHPPV